MKTYDEKTGLKLESPDLDADKPYYATYVED